MSENSGKRIGIIGSGAIGGYYGTLLALAGYEVHFLLRSEYETVVLNGLRLLHANQGELHLHPVNAWNSVEHMPKCDWLLVGAKSTSNAEIAPLVAEAAAPGARVLMMQNGLGVEEVMRHLLPDSLHVLGGLCFILVHRQAPGVVHHQAQGVCNVGYHSGPASEKAEQQAIVGEIVQMFQQAGIESTELSDLPSARWQKLVWNIPYNGLSVLLDADTEALMTQPNSREMVRQLMQEVIDAAMALGYNLPNNYAAKLMAFTDKMPAYLPSMYHDFSFERPAEIAAIYDVPLREADRRGISMPRVQMLRDQLVFLAHKQAARRKGH